MSAHTRSIEHHCLRCGQRATVEVFNTWNSSIGYFCKRHGEERVREMNLAPPPVKR